MAFGGDDDEGPAGIFDVFYLMILVFILFLINQISTYL